MNNIQLEKQNNLTQKNNHPGWVQGLKIAIVAIVLSLFVWIVPGTVQTILLSVQKPYLWHFKTDTLVVAHETERLNKDIATLNSKLKSYIPNTNYLIINSTENLFFLYRGSTLIREGKCSTGSYLQLEKGDKQKWLFKTPKGEFKIRNKRTEPVWKKPDWAFIEEGLPIPSANHPSRFEYGVLGDYALSLGDGYMIHGTLYQRYLGLPVTHGCVRLSDADLEVVYKSLPMGAKVYIF